MTRIYFNRPLSDVDFDLDESQSLIYAYSASNNDNLGYHGMAFESARARAHCADPRVRVSCHPFPSRPFSCSRPLHRQLWQRHENRVPAPSSNASCSRRYPFSGLRGIEQGRALV